MLTEREWERVRTEISVKEMFTIAVEDFSSTWHVAHTFHNQHISLETARKRSSNVMKHLGTTTADCIVPTARLHAIGQVQCGPLLRQSGLLNQPSTNC